MMEGILNALSGLRAASRKLQNSANNVAKLQTPGFKNSQVNLKATKSGGMRASETSRTNAQTGASGQGKPDTGGFGNVTSGAFELSNVDLSSEAVDQIVTKTAFKANAKVIKTMDDINGSILDIKA